MGVAITVCDFGTTTYGHVEPTFDLSLHTGSKRDVTCAVTISGVHHTTCFTCYGDEILVNGSIRVRSARALSYGTGMCCESAGRISTSQGHRAGVLGRLVACGRPSHNRTQVENRPLTVP